MRRKWLIFLFILGLACFTIAMKERKEISMTPYVALGDSYTIGEGAKPDEAFPNLLVKHFDSTYKFVGLMANPAVTGFTTQDLIEKELPVYDREKPGFVTLLIGVNDWVQGVDSATYHKNLNYIIDHIQTSLIKKDNLLLITIPDFGVTPTGKLYGNGRDISKGITEFNNILINEAHKRNLPLVDIFPESQKMKDNPDLIAKDGLHPSAKEYALWEKLIFPVADTLVKVGM